MLLRLIGQFFWNSHSLWPQQKLPFLLLPSNTPTYTPNSPHTLFSHSLSQLDFCITNLCIMLCKKVRYFINGYPIFLFCLSNTKILCPSSQTLFEVGVENIWACVAWGLTKVSEGSSTFLYTYTYEKQGVMYVDSKSEMFYTYMFYMTYHSVTIFVSVRITSYDSSTNLGYDSFILHRFAYYTFLSDQVTD